MNAIDAHHHLLLRFAGRVSDDLIRHARTWLAAGRTGDVARALLHAATAGGLALAPADGELLGAAGSVAGLPVFTRTPPIGYEFAPVPPALLARFGTAVPLCLDVTEEYADSGVTDDVDAAAIAAAAGAGAPTALWRAWRHPGFGAAWPPPARVFLAQVAPGAGLASTAAALQEALAAPVEVFAELGDLPGYQRAAYERGALLWTRAERHPITVLPVFPVADELPGFGADHPRLRDGTLLRYLSGGTPILSTRELTSDLVVPERGAVVPMGLRTDGRLIWSDAAAYYLAEHGLAPDPALLAAAASGDRPAPVDAVTLHRCLAAVLNR